MRFGVSRVGGFLLFLSVFLVSACVTQLTEEDYKTIFEDYIKGYVSPEYFSDHFEIKKIYVSPEPKTATVFYVIKYENITALTRSATKTELGLISGLTRITNGTIEEYHGPLKEYELKIREERAREIMIDNGCTDIGDLTLNIGDYIYKGGKYPDDVGMEGFYWSGGMPKDGRIGDECTVNAETGVFKVKLAARY